MLTDPSAEPSLDHCISQACTSSQFRAESYRFWCRRIGEKPRLHRKQWEFCYILQALASRGVLCPGSRGIGYGVGKEPLSSVLASYGCAVLATDLDSATAVEKGWTSTNEHVDQKATINERGLCEPEEFDRLVDFRVVDMNNIPSSFRDYDFTWSSCCLEHLGSLQHGLTFIEESVKTLRPGGIAVHTTEYNCSSNEGTVETGGTVIYRRRDLESLVVRLIGFGHEVTVNFNTGTEPLDAHVDVPPYSSDTHLKLHLMDYVTTSFGLIIKKSAAG